MIAFVKLAIILKNVEWVQVYVIVMSSLYMVKIIGIFLLQNVQKHQHQSL